jgi:hypothetical protein
VRALCQRYEIRISETWIWPACDGPAASSLTHTYHASRPDVSVMVCTGTSAAATIAGCGLRCKVLAVVPSLCKGTRMSLNHSFTRVLGQGFSFKAVTHCRSAARPQGIAVVLQGSAGACLAAWLLLLLLVTMGSCCAAFGWLLALFLLEGWKQGQGC